jgi:hypothetical protein
MGTENPTAFEKSSNRLREKTRQMEYRREGLEFERETAPLIH